MELTVKKGNSERTIKIISPSEDDSRLKKLLETYWNKLLSIDPDNISTDPGSIVFLRPSIRVEDAPLNRAMTIFDDQPVFVPVDVVEMDEFDARYFNIGQDFTSPKDRLQFARQQLALAEAKPRQIFIENTPIMKNMDEFYVEVEDFQVTVDSASKIAGELGGYIPVPKEPVSASIVGYCMMLERLPSTLEPYHIHIYSEGILGYYAMADYSINVKAHDSR
jgi:hypothetical protein